MSWQDELQKLDAELATGRVSADEYRRLRDELLAGATSAPAQAAPPQSNPFPEPVKWQSAPPTPEKTQFIKPVTGPQPVQQPPQQNSDRTQVVSVNGGGGAPSNPDATQVVPGSGGFPQPNYNQPQFPQNQGWQQNAGNSGNTPPPWVTGDSDFGSSPAWGHQGPDVFDSAGESSGKGKKIVGIVIVVLLVAGLGVAGYFFLNGKKDNEAQPPPQQNTTQSTPAAKPLPDPPAEKPDAGASADSIFGPLPGTERPGGGQFDLAKMAAQKLMAGKANEALTAGAMTEATLSTTTDGKNTISIMAMSVKDDAAAGKVIAAYFQDQTGLKEDKDNSYKGVKVVTDPKKNVLRAAYVYYNKAIVVEVFTSNGGDKANPAEKQFKELLKNQLEFAPPTVK